VKTALWAAIAVLLLTLAAFAIGRGTAPVKVEKKVEIEIVEVESVRIEWRDKIVEKKVYVKSQATSSRTEEREVRKPDGTVEKTKMEVRGMETLVSSGTESSSEQSGTARKDSQISSKEIMSLSTENKPDWNISLLVGASTGSKLLPPPMTAGVHVQRRILGPVYVGVWGMTDVSAGLSVGFEF
jgi:hypothetical protein